MNAEDIYELIERFEHASIAELDWKQGEERIRLRKESAFAATNASGALMGWPYNNSTQEMTCMQGAQTMQSTQDPAGMRSAGVQADNVGVGQTSAKEAVEQIHAPLVGTFYAASSPEDAPFVKEGSQVKAGDVVCLIEAMKMLSEVRADHDCVIDRVLVKDGEVVSFDQPLFTLK